MRRLVFRLERPHHEGGRQSWVGLADVWLTLRPLRGRLALRSGVAEQVATHEARLRWRDDVKAGMRFRRRSQVLEIHTVEDVGQRHRRLSCLCEERRPVETGLAPPEADNNTGTPDDD